MERTEHLRELNGLNEQLLQATAQLSRSGSITDAGHADSLLSEYRELLAQMSAQAKALVGPEREQLQSAVQQHEEAAREFSSQISRHREQLEGSAAEFMPQGEQIRQMTAQARTRLDEGTVTSAQTADEIVRENMEMHGIAENAEAVEEGFEVGGMLASLIKCTEQKHYISQWSVCIVSLSFLIGIGIWRICVVVSPK